MKIKQGITFQQQTDLVELTIHEYPIWRGVQDKPGVSNVMPLKISARSNGYISQTTGSEDTSTTEFLDYASQEYQFLTPTPGEGDWGMVLGKRKIELITKLFANSKPKSIMEIGGANVWIAREVMNRFDVGHYVIVDPALKSQDDRVEIISDYYPNRQTRSRKFDLILSFSVLEHVPNPRAFLEGLRNNLTQDGVALLFLPDCGRQLREGDLNMLTHEHLSFFTERDLRHIAVMSDLEVVDLESANDAFILVVRPATARKLQFQEASTESITLLSLFHDRLTNLLNSKAEEIRCALDSGNTVGFHGATEGLNTFLALTGLGYHPRIRIYDGDRSKEGRYMGGSNAEIERPGISSYKQIDLMLISSLSYEQEIRDYILRHTIIRSDRISRLCGD